MPATASTVVEMVNGKRGKEEDALRFLFFVFIIARPFHIIFHIMVNGKRGKEEDALRFIFIIALFFHIIILIFIHFLIFVTVLVLASRGRRRTLSDSCLW